MRNTDTFKFSVNIWIRRSSQNCLNLWKKYLEKLYPFIYRITYSFKHIIRDVKIKKEKQTSK